MLNPTQPFNKLSKYVIIIFSVSMLLGCGFKLKGSMPLFNKFKVLCILPEQMNDPFQRLLKQSFIAQGIHIQSTSEAKAYTLTILDQNFAEQSLGLTAGNQPASSQLILSIHYQLRNDEGTIIIDNQPLVVTREYNINPNAVLQLEKEKESLKNDLYNDAVSQLFRQLALLK